ncbi:MAG: hypothetical protein Hals2KO_02610 [Halioglobus sp.]
MSEYPQSRSIHPDHLDDLREEARWNVRDLVKGGDVTRKNEAFAVEEEYQRLIEAHSSEPART